jgi:kumamolisin
MPSFIPLPGSRRSPLANSRPAGPVDLSEIATLTVRVPSVGNLTELELWVDEESRKPLADRRYLSRGEHTARYGADPAVLDRVEQYAALHNLFAVRRSAAQRTLVLRGTLGDSIKAFPANLHMYHHSEGSYRGRSGEILIPKELRESISGIFGFDTRPKRRSTYRTRVSLSDGPGGANGQPASFFARQYDFPQNYQGVALDGSGQNIAIIELGGGYQTSDLATYFAGIGSPMPSVTFVSVDNAGNLPGTDTNSDGEVMLDIEVVGSAAPKANIVVYFAPNQGDQGFIDAINTAIHDAERSIDVISISWGSPEPDPADQKEMQELSAYHELFVSAASMGISVCVATGDHGTADLDAFHWDRKIHVDHPACDDHVLACGGTQIDAAGNDVAWNDGTAFNTSTDDGGGWASGGGISKCYAVPDYQQNANLPVSLDGGTSGRGTPDIAMSATNYFVRVDSAEYASGGTSAVAPLMASLIALLNQAKGKNVGFLNPFLYAKAASGVVRDVTQGTNGIADTVTGYNAGPGWDACTGLGTPIGTGILNNL